MLAGLWSGGPVPQRCEGNEKRPSLLKHVYAPCTSNVHQRVQQGLFLLVSRTSATLIGGVEKQSDERISIEEAMQICLSPAHAKSLL